MAFLWGVVLAKPTTAATEDGRGNREVQPLTETGQPAKTSSYAWDHQDRLVGVTDPAGGAHAYAYDYRTRRIARSEPGRGHRSELVGRPVAGGVSRAKACKRDCKRGHATFLDSRKTIMSSGT